MKSWFSFESSFPLRAGCSAEPLIDGPEFFAALDEEAARSKTVFVALSFANEAFFGAMVERWCRTCTVYVLAWLPHERNPLFSGVLEPPAEQLPAACHVRWTSSAPDRHHCHHEKSFVFDFGRVAVTGGLIPSASWASHGNHDVGVRLRGGVAQDVASSFVQRWNSNMDCRELHRAENLTMPPFDPSVVGDAMCRVARSLRPGIVDPFGEASVLAMWQHAIRSARRWIYIEQQHLVHEELMKDLIAALARGCKIIYLRPGLDEANAKLPPTPIDLAPLRGRTRATYERCFLELMPQLEHPNFLLAGLRGVHVHSKLLIVDDEFVAVGSANLVDISMDLGPELHSEICVGIADKAMAQRFRRRLFEEHCGSKKCGDTFESFCEYARKGDKKLLLYAMSPTEWGKHILPRAVDIFERARK